MGEGLAMKPMRSLLAALAALALVSGCSSNSGAGADSTFDLLGKALREKARSIGKPDPADEPIPVTRAMVEAAGIPVYFARVENSRAYSTLIVLGQNGRDVSWTAVDGSILVFRDEVLRATRGMGEDLMSSTVPEAAALRRGTGFTQREYYYVDGEDHTFRRKFTCSLSRAGNERIEVFELVSTTFRVQEACQGESGAFMNEYWFNNRGQMVQSRQWVSESVGFLKLQRLK